MIKVNVEDYCHNCLDFNPDVSKPDRYSRGDGEEIIFTDTIIRCQYRKRCAGIKRYLEQKYMENT